MMFVIVFLVISFLCCVVPATEVGRLNTLETLVKELQQQRQDDVRRIQILENTVKEHNRHTRLLQSGTSVTSSISFMAHISKDLTRIGNNHIFQFDHVITNNGNAYKPMDGMFHAPVPGTYVFAWMITNRDHTYMNSELRRNGVRVARSMSDAMDHGDYAAATNVAVINLEVGDEVWIQSGTWHSGVIAGDDYSTFSGWLLH